LQQHIFINHRQYFTRLFFAFIYTQDCIEQSLAMLPAKPLKILTIDGGGLQAITTLLILDKLLDTIANINKAHQKPRPCDVFDTIAGIGAGGWLAILLGRFRMDITTCLSEWYKITDRITPRSKSEELRMRTFHHCYFNPERLVEQIDSLTKVYGTGKYLFDDRVDKVRTRHVFVAALRTDASGYNLFRTYAIPEDAAKPEKLLEGPEEPHQFHISRAFGVTGAAKYFSPPWHEQMSKSGRTLFNDSKYPKPHNITELALDEMWGLYGTAVPLSVVVNIGPGLPSECDLKLIARRFSWGLTPSLYVQPQQKPKSPISSKENAENTKQLHPEPEDSSAPDQRSNLVRFQDGTTDHESARVPVDRKQQLAHRTTFGSVTHLAVGQKLRRRETEIEKNIKAKLDAFYPRGSELYYRLAPDHAPQGTVRNDSFAPGVTLDATNEFLELPVTEIKIDGIVEQMGKPAIVA
jgi:hypothetical protein